MKDFFKGKRWDDYLAYVIMFTMIIGMIMFFIGYYWGFETGYNVLGNNANVHKIAGNIGGCRALFNAEFGVPDGKMDIFTLMSYMSPEWGVVYSMCVVALTGFSLIMFGILLIVVMLLVGLILEVIVPKIKAKKAK